VLPVAQRTCGVFFMSLPLEKRTIALAEGRQLEELAGLLEKEGAVALRCPLVAMVDSTDTAGVVAWLRELASDGFDYVVLLTGEGLRRLLGFAEREGLRTAVVAALGRSRIVTRGPKPVKALREIGLGPSLVAQAPTSEGVIQTLTQEPLRGRTVGVQLAGVDNPPLRQFLEHSGAIARTVLPYVYAPALDAERVADLIRRLAAGTIDALVFTSSPQVDRLYEAAAECRLDSMLTAGLARVRVAAVGPVVAEGLHRRGVRVHICPEQGFVMKNLVQLIKRELGTPSGSAGR
jgi:uroporphyrinogen-III synthase